MEENLVDTLPTGLKVAPVPNIGGNCKLASNNTASNVITAAANANTITLATGSRIPATGCTLTVDVRATAPGSYTNTIVSGALNTTTGVNAAAASATYQVIPQPNLSVTVKGTVNAVVGGQVGYVYDISNNSATDPADNVTFTPTLPAGLNNVTWACHTLDTLDSACNGSDMGSALPITGLKIAPSSKLRITVQGNATVAGPVTGSGQAVSGTISSNVATLNTTISGFPPLCSTVPVQVIRPPSNLRNGVTWPLDSTNAVTTAAPGTQGSTSGVGTSTLAYQPVTLGAAATQQRGVGDFTYTVTLAKAVPAKQFYFTVQDVNYDNPITAVTVTGGATSADFVPMIVAAENAGTNRPLIYDSTAATGRLYRQVTTAEAVLETELVKPKATGNMRNSVHLFGVGEALVKSFSVTSVYRSNDLIAFLYGAQVRCAALAITKTTDTNILGVHDLGGTLAYTPAQVGYTITVTNIGGEPGTGITVTDTLPTGLTYASSTGVPALITGQPTSNSPVLTFTLPTLAAGASQVYTVKVAPNLTAGVNQSNKINTATASSSATGVASVTSAPVTTQIAYPKLNKRVSNITRPTAPAGTGLPGEILEYCVDAINHGTVALNNFVLTDDVPASTSAQTSAYGTGLGVKYTAAGIVQPPRTSAADGDGGRLTTSGGGGKGTMTLNIGTLAPATTYTGCFRARID